MWFRGRFPICFFGLGPLSKLVVFMEQMHGSHCTTTNNVFLACVGLCSHLAHLWATFDSAPRSEAVGTPQAVGVM